MSLVARRICGVFVSLHSSLSFLNLSGNREDFNSSSKKGKREKEEKHRKKTKHTHSSPSSLPTTHKIARDDGNSNGERRGIPGIMGASRNRIDSIDTSVVGDKSRKYRSSIASSLPNAGEFSQRCTRMRDTGDSRFYIYISTYCACA